ncbi:crotonase/enoyl-CoA hydratase family protein [Ketobacter alkanivorans]|uniref:Enoyl-CoA hydratase n=1 Tax=Ketobacter alkanivorans TaxID=1917421 RepID=A0A2K9LI39_9GAMM|nr:crotonase/enoyl-CoA hydratase family protein [Ketobacter alkanivorans]AUM11831.1 enoyl-CoA hydratase [Ketobacter alkanivorans]
MAHVETSTEGHILLIRINRAEKYNALSPEMYHDMGKALMRLNSDPELRVAVLYAEGKHFTAGVELDKWAPIFGSGNAFPVGEDEIDPMGLTGERHTKPVIIAVQGYCFTWGVEILLNTEIRVAARDTQFQMLEVQRGLYPCGGATLRLPVEAGWGNAQRVLLTGERWSAEDAYRWGMIQELVEPGEQFNKAMEIAQSVAKAAPLGVQGVLKATRFSAAHPHDQDASVQQFMADLKPVMQSEDAAEGVNSFMERREAVFKGR